MEPEPGEDGEILQRQGADRATRFDQHFANEDTEARDDDATAALLKNSDSACNDEDDDEYDDVMKANAERVIELYNKPLQLPDLLENLGTPMRQATKLGDRTAARDDNVLFAVNALELLQKEDYHIPSASQADEEDGKAVKAPPLASIGNWRRLQERTLREHYWQTKRSRCARKATDLCSQTLLWARGRSPADSLSRSLRGRRPAPLPPRG